MFPQGPPGACDVASSFPSFPTARGLSELRGTRETVVPSTEGLTTCGPAGDGNKNPQAPLATQRLVNADGPSGTFGEQKNRRNQPSAQGLRPEWVVSW